LVVPERLLAGLLLEDHRAVEEARAQRLGELDDEAVDFISEDDFRFRVCRREGAFVCDVQDEGRERGVVLSRVLDEFLAGDCGWLENVVVGCVIPDSPLCGFEFGTSDADKLVDLGGDD
jgi:hypothetical protein